MINVSLTITPGGSGSKSVSVAQGTNLEKFLIDQGVDLKTSDINLNGSAVTRDQARNTILQNWADVYVSRSVKGA